MSVQRAASQQEINQNTQQFMQNPFVNRLYRGVQGSRPGDLLPNVTNSLADSGAPSGSAAPGQPAQQGFTQDQLNAILRQLMGGSGGGPTGPNPAVLEGINRSYDAYDAGLQRLAGFLPEQQANWASQIANNYQVQHNLLDNGRASSLDQLNAARQQVAANQSRSFRDLGQQLKNVFAAGNLQIGNMGAGDSSAPGAYTYALAQLNNQNRGRIQEQTGDQMSQLGLRENDIGRGYQDQLGQLEAWKSNQLLNMAQQVQQQLAQIEQQRLGANQERNLALTNLSQTLGQQALARLKALDDQVGSIRAGIDQAQQARLDAVNQMQNAWGQLSQYTPPALQYNQIQVPSFGNAIQQSPQYWSGYPYSYKDQNQPQLF